MSAEEKIEIHRGLKGVYFERSATTFIDGKAGELRYRGYSIHDLATSSTFEETAYLLLHGELPTAAELQAFDAQLKAARQLPDPVLSVIETVKTAHPMDVLRTAVSALAAFDRETADNGIAATRAKGIRLTAQVPMIVAAHGAMRVGRPLPEADPRLSHAANFLAMVTGRQPSEEAARLMDRDLILHAEHGSNASSFAARVVIGTEANLHAAITALLGLGLLRLRCSTEIRSWLLVGLTTVELMIVSASLVATTPAQPLTQQPALASLVNMPPSESDAPNASTGMFRIYRSTDWLPKFWVNEASPDRLERSFAWDHETLFPRHPLRWQLSYLSGTSSLVPADLKFVLDAGRIASDRDGVEFAPPLLNLLSAGTLVLPPDASPSDWTPLVPAKRGAEEQVSIWKNARALPRVRIVRAIVQLPPLEDRSLTARKKRTELVLFDHGVWRDFQSIAVIEASEPILKPIEPPFDRNAIDPSTASLTNTSSTAADRLAIRDEAPHRVVVEAVLHSAGLLVFGDLAAPGWIATVESTDSPDQSPTITPILRTNRVQRGVWLERGSHRVTFRYQPSAFYQGALVSLCAWGVWLVMAGRTGLYTIRRHLRG